MFFRCAFCVFNVVQYHSDQHIEERVIVFNRFIPSYLKHGVKIKVTNTEAHFAGEEHSVKKERNYWIIDKANKEASN